MVTEKLVGGSGSIDQQAKSRDHYLAGGPGRTGIGVGDLIDSEMVAVFRRASIIGENLLPESA